MTEMLIILGATACIFLSAVVIFKLEHKALKEEFRAASADFNVQCSEAMLKLKEQNRKDQNDLACANLDMMQKIKDDLIYFKEKPIEGVTLVLEDNEENLVSVVVKKAVYPKADS